MADPTSIARFADIKRFYTLLDRLNQQLGGARTLAEVGKFHDWPERGVYFFFEPSEVRRDSGNGLRVVRVGTHALGRGSLSTLRQRLGQHRGSLRGGGNHRGSIFRLLVGQALLTRGGLPDCASWGVKGEATHAARQLGIDRKMLAEAEAPIERAVSDYLSTMPFLWIAVDDQSGPDSLRGFIERNTIGLLSNYGRTPLDPPSLGWLGRAFDRAGTGFRTLESAPRR